MRVVERKINPEEAVAYWRSKISNAERHKFMNPGIAYTDNPTYYDKRIATYEKELALAMERLDRAKLKEKGIL